MRQWRLDAAHEQLHDSGSFCLDRWRHVRQRRVDSGPYGGPDCTDFGRQLHNPRSLRVNRRRDVLEWWVGAAERQLLDA